MVKQEKAAEFLRLEMEKRKALADYRLAKARLDDTSQNAFNVPVEHFEELFRIVDLCVGIDRRNGNRTLVKQTAEDGLYRGIPGGHPLLAIRWQGGVGGRSAPNGVETERH